MKTSLLTLLITGLILITTSEGCRKYPEGPTLSLRSKTARVTNAWKVEYYQENGNDKTSSYSGYRETYTASGDYYFSSDPGSGSGKWAFQDHSRQIRITGVNNQPSRTLYILKLEERSFWYYYFDANERKEFHLIPY